MIPGDSVWYYIGSTKKTAAKSYISWGWDSDGHSLGKRSSST